MPMFDVYANFLWLAPRGTFYIVGAGAMEGVLHIKCQFLSLIQQDKLHCIVL